MRDHTQFSEEREAKARQPAEQHNTTHPAFGEAETWHGARKLGEKSAYEDTHKQQRIHQRRRLHGGLDDVTVPPRVKNRCRRCS
uniref:Uncharacterized protein n=1 Tax=Caenorhabditis japonica TaxID=281687 RepID=A0A8R1IRP9_CAEJA